MVSGWGLKRLRSLRQKSRRREEGRLLVEGVRLVEEAVRHGSAVEVLFGPEAEDERAAALRGCGLPVRELTAAEAGRLAETHNSQQVFALCRDPTRDVGSMTWPASAIAIVADGVADPGNLGSIMRTAAALGAEAAVVTPGTVDPTNSKVVRGTMGALFALPVLRGSKEALREAGFEIWIADAGGEPVAGMDRRPARVALVVGNEPRGFAGGEVSGGDRVVAIPLTTSRVESLNVAAATAILLDRIRSLSVDA